jgi:ribonuclease HI
MKFLFTDGSCLKNPGFGGWAFILISDDHEIHSSDNNEFTTNNKMELTAVIEGLKLIEENEECKIYSDSLYVINCALGIWKRKKNVEMWKEYDKVSCNKIIHFEWVKAHSGNKYNEKVDKMALKEARSLVK